MELNLLGTSHKNNYVPSPSARYQYVIRGNVVWVVKYDSFPKQPNRLPSKLHFPPLDHSAYPTNQLFKLRLLGN